MTPPHMVVEMQMMKERMNFMMNALKGRVSNDSCRAGSLDRLAVHGTCHFIPPACKVPYVANRVL